jgi:hypothetical protein
VSVHSRLALKAVPLILATACSTQPVALQSASEQSKDDCIAGKPCTLTGQLGIQLAVGRYSTAYIDLNDMRCIPLLLSKAMFQKYQKLNGKTVTLTGEALAKAAVADDVVEIEYRDRWLQTGFCGQSAIVVYVDALTATKP